MSRFTVVSAKFIFVKKQGAFHTIILEYLDTLIFFNGFKLLLAVIGFPQINCYI